MLPGRTKAEGDELRAVETRERERAEIQARLAALDEQSARPLRAIAAGTATEADRVVLAEIESQAVKLRARLAELNA